MARNIEEGAGPQSNREFVRFLDVAPGSACEPDTQLETSRLLGLGNAKTTAELKAAREHVSRMLHGPIRSLKRRLDTAP